jgi:amino acid adenylation domain-containing protein
MQPDLLPREDFPVRDTDLPCSPAASLAARIASHAAVAPDRPAVADGTDRLTYADLECQANQLAAHLRDAGAGPECVVGLFLERSAQFVVAALAVLKTGAAYLPLDSSTPAERTTFILGDAGALLLLTHRGKARDLAPGPWRVIETDGPGAAQIAGRPAAPVHVKPAPASLAYVIYTSGSTGRPKGVEITHANLANLIAWHQAAFGVTAADRASQVAGLGFDAAVWEIWPYLTAGASLHVADEPTRRSAPALRDWLVAERITISFVPTVLAEQMLHADWPAGTALRTLLTGGDTLRRRPAAGLPFVLVNNYGPTECTVVSTSGTVAPGGDEGGPPSIGRPIANATALILDDALRPVRPGEAGELCMAGALVGRGYRNNPAETASRFVTVSPPSGPALRVYRTGDRARLLPGGEIAFLGRRDEQVKVRGYRVELGEIASCLGRCPGIAACAVTAREAGGDGDGAVADGLLLVAYVVAARDARPSAAGLREYLAARLPDYMVPAHYVALAALPVTANGKLDKSALPAPAPDNLLPGRPAAGPAVAATDPADKYQRPIAALVASLLEQPSVGAEDNFFMLGGHSMLGVQLAARIKDLYGVKLTLRQLFTAPTVAALSAEVARLAGEKP